MANGRIPWSKKPRKEERKDGKTVFFYYLIPYMGVWLKPTSRMVFVN